VRRAALAAAQPEPDIGDLLFDLGALHRKTGKSVIVIVSPS